MNLEISSRRSALSARRVRRPPGCVHLADVDEKRVHYTGALAVGPDQGVDGSGVGQRPTPEEPVPIAMDLGMS